MNTKLSTSEAGSINEPLAINGGKPVRTEPLPLEFPGVHHMDEEETNAALRIVRSRSLFRFYGVDPQGEADTFESEFARFLGVSKALALTSGSAALHLALLALGVGPGQEVIVPAYMWVAVAAAVVNLGAIPVLADIDDTFCLDPNDVERRITPRTRGVIAVHMSGAQADMKRLLKITKSRGLFLVEDCAQCAGGSIDGQKVGTFGDIGVFSFQTNKNMSSGEGGCLVTNDSSLYKRAFACHDTGYARDDSGRAMFNDLEYCLWGRGYRLDELRASILRVQLKKLPRVIANMHRSKYRIREAIAKLPGVQLRRIVDTAGDTSCFLLTTFATAETAHAVNKALRAEGIVTYPQGVTNVVMTEWGLHIYYNIVSLVNKTSTDTSGFPWKLQENQHSKTSYAKGTCSHADSLFERTILLTIASCLTSRDEDDIIAAFSKVLGELAPGRTT
jgi:dTDP-4-amino-4,6-dideoxygalactose transaminase